MSKFVSPSGLLRGLFLPLAAGAMVVAVPAQAQFSQGYRFLESVKKKNGQEVIDALNEPGSTLVNTRDVTTGQTALHLVTARRDLTWMNFLLGKGANVNARDNRGETPLVLACSLNFVEGVQLLVDNKARVDEPTATGETPLISAVHTRNITLMRILLRAGANPDRADNSGRSARDYAALEGRGGPLLSEIEKNAKPAGGATGQQRTYGPSF